ncbi:MAG: family 65 glycosyl hydrolase [Clostridiales bacterium]|jgi:alpha,alpha-trehalose phosphorylase|nr:family 65 glycosyl hydrolase [Clostridiales bacterium]
MKEKQLIYEIKYLSTNKDELVLNETVFHNANGYIGIRSNFEEGYPEGFDSIRGSYINGFYDFAEMKQAEKLFGLVEEKQTMLNVADSQTIRIILDDEEFNMFEGTTLESKRWLDMANGYTGRKIVWRSPNGKIVEIVIKRMTSFYQLSLFTIEYSVTALNFDGEVRFVSSHIGEVMNYSNPNDPRVAGESFKHLLPTVAKIEEGASYLTSHTSRSGLSVCTGVKNILSKECSMHTSIEEHSSTSTFDTSIVKNETIVLTKYTVFSDSIRHKDCESHAMKEMEMALSVSLATIYGYQTEYLNKYWDNCFLDIDGDDDLSLAVSYNMYQLIQSVGKDEYSNIAAKGLSGEGYEGHYFWDTEMYIQPFFTLTNPSVAKNLIEHRYTILEAARDNAKILGHKKGALYPWRTIMGKECSGYFPSGSAQYHINGDIAYSVISYYLATKDIDFIASKGAEIIFETARLWIDAGNFYNGRFRINEVTGPDEYTCMVDNNYYTNASAQYNLQWASNFYYLLKSTGKLCAIESKINLTEYEVKEFERAANFMYLPFDDKLKINPQDDSFLSKAVWDIENTPKDKFPLLLHYHPLYLYRHQVCKQADTVLAHFIFEDAQSLDTIHNSFKYYEKVTTHDSSLSTCIFSIVASKLGLEDEAYGYFGDSAKLDLFNTHKNTKDGIHTANMGGSYMAIVYGFAGLRLKESGLYFAPTLPKIWTGYRFKVNFEGSQINVQVKENQSTFTLINGSKKQIYVYGKEYELKDTITIMK